MDDNRIIKDIEGGGSGMEKAVQELYDRNFGFVIKAKRKYKLGRESVLDAYADAIVSVKSHVEKGIFRGDSKLSTYLYSIFQRRCIDQLRKSTTNEIVWTYELPAHLANPSPGIQHLLEVKESVAHVLNLLNQLGTTCRKVLIDWAYLGYDMKEVAHRSSLKDAKTATSKKYTCLQQLRKLISKEGGTHE